MTMMRETSVTETATTQTGETAAPQTPSRSPEGASRLPLPSAGEERALRTASGFPAAPRDANGRFLPGSPGRQPGQRNLISGRVTRHLLRDFEADCDELLPRMKRWFLPQYMRMIAQLLPKNGSEGVEGLDAAELAAALKEALAAAEAAAER